MRLQLQLVAPRAACPRDTRQRIVEYREEIYPPTRLVSPPPPSSWTQASSNFVPLIHFTAQWGKKLTKISTCILRTPRDTSPGHPGCASRGTPLTVDLDPAQPRALAGKVVAMVVPHKVLVGVVDDRPPVGHGNARPVGPGPAASFSTRASNESPSATTFLDAIQDASADRHEVSRSGRVRGLDGAACNGPGALPGATLAITR